MDWRNWNNVVDVSSFMLFESTGDSEADSDLNMVASFSDDNMEVTYEVDDVLSCCSDSSESVRDYNDDQDQEYAQFSKKKEQDYAHYDYNPHYRDHIDDDDGAIDQDWSSGKEGFVFSRKKKSNLYEDSTLEPMKEEEKDKLFWETCLAS